MKITKTKLKQIIKEELKRLVEGEVIPADFKNKTVGSRLPDEMPKDEIPLERTLKAMISDLREKYDLAGALLKSARGDAMQISEFSRAVEDGFRIEADMLEIISALEEASVALDPLEL